ncbi:hypothetical protein NGA_0593900 [Nannochloropsis gaditana CCMP526]|uniref:uncharacterized protein n=1 Tax=Nannochloropsis gaditana (strain CCMP526) TaxID=1093141 RepID=UPI00029F701E|nr:hypothetical protein NGA_0593900 [Nannochloropsis gaditana CCMP526]EKU20805.1 hypothetical protein NGA_0593900 [Nannochloropsis gaditana CCMP526]|eukprot:XP_005855556.1 hypothetical protein NGA_0593900 [Nannochloropsis gaditana CCMP526]
MTQQRPHGDGVVADRAAFEAKYQFVRAIGDGGQAGVYEYRRRAAPEKRVAVKEFGSLTSREWRILAAVRHPHICGLVDEARYENPRVRTTKIVVDCMDMNLQSFLQARQRHAGKEGKPSVEENKKNKSADCQEKEQRRLHKVKKGGWDGGEGEGLNLPKAAMDVETVREILHQAGQHPPPP